MGGHRPKFMRLAAEKADIWQWDGPIDRFRAPYDLLVAACADLGRRCGASRLTVQVSA